MPSLHKYIATSISQYYECKATIIKPFVSKLPHARTKSPKKIPLKTGYFWSLIFFPTTPVTCMSDIA